MNNDTTNNAATAKLAPWEDPATLGRNVKGVPMMVPVTMRGAKGAVESIPMEYLVSPKTGKAYLKGKSSSGQVLVGFFDRSGNIWLKASETRAQAF